MAGRNFPSCKYGSLSFGWGGIPGGVEDDAGTWGSGLMAHLLALGVLTVQVADLAVLDCWKDTSKLCGPG